MSVKIIEGYKEWRYRFKLGGEVYRGGTGVSIELPKEKALVAEGKIRADTERDIAKGAKDAKVGMRLGEAVRKYWEHHGRLHYRGSENNLLWIASVIGEKTPLRNITDLDVENLKARRRAEVRVGKHKQKPLSLRGIDETTLLLRLVMKYAKEHWKVAIPEMPNWKAHRLYNHRKMKRAGQYIERAVTDNEEEAIEAVETEDCRDVRLFLTLQGMRIGRECLTLEWNRNVDFVNRKLKFTQKGGYERTMAMAPGVYELLKAQEGKHPVKVWTYKCRRARRRPDPKNPARLITLRETGQYYPLTYGYFTARRYADWHKKAGVKKRAHDLRHRFAKQALESGVPIEDLSELMGHSDISITKENYVQPLSHEQQEERLAQVARHRLEVKNRTRATVVQVGSKKAPRRKGAQKGA